MIKKILKITGLVILIVLASLGIGITGAAPISSNKGGREGCSETKIEQVDESEELIGISEVREIR